MHRCNCRWFSDHCEGGTARHTRRDGLRPCGERDPFHLSLTLTCIPCSCTEMHPATREPERVCITSPRARPTLGSMVHGFALPSRTNHPFPVTLPLSDSLSLPLFPAVTSCSLPIHLPNFPSLVHPRVNHCPYPGGQWRNFKFRASRDVQRQELTSTRNGPYAWNQKQAILREKFW